MLVTHTFDDLEALVYKAIQMETKCKVMLEERKHRMMSQGGSSSHRTHNYPTPGLHLSHHGHLLLHRTPTIPTVQTTPTAPMTTTVPEAATTAMQDVPMSSALSVASEDTIIKNAPIQRMLLRAPMRQHQTVVKAVAVTEGMSRHEEMLLSQRVF